MNKFYGEDINKINEEYLLKATPFVKDTRINFSGKLTPEVFFSELYTERILDVDNEVNKENDIFDRNIQDSLRCIGNKFAKVDLIHIAGYGGCGKTTFMRHLLWNLLREENLGNEIVDFEGAKRVVEPFVERISLQLYSDKNNIFFYLKKLLSLEIFKLNRFQEVKSYLEELVLEYDKKDGEDQDCIQNIIMQQENKFQTYDKYFYYLLVIDFLIQLYKSIGREEMTPMIIVFDNVDSISNLKEEITLVSILKEFINDCNFFFGENIYNEKKYGEKLVCDIVHKTKFVFFLTTRMITIKKFLELEPDLEKVYGWVSLKMPEHYYNHRAIIDKRVKFYEKNEEGKVSSTIKNLRIINNFSSMVYRTYHFKRFFNGNVRYCFDTLCKLGNIYSSTTLLEECETLYSFKVQTNDVLEGVNGIIMSLLLNYFKENGIYNEKLHLSECQCDKKISFSRIILTIIREKGGSCSLLELFKLLSPLNSLEDICDVIWDLSESKREIWRRLITFNIIIPKDRKELKVQIDLYENGNYDIEQYSEIDICTAGCAYMDYVVPSFEFMLSRHKYGVAKLQDKNYQPLFSNSSEDVIKSKEEYRKYRFERKIDWVYKDVADCCVNSVFFANMVMEKFNLNRYEYINNSYFNYHTINRDGTSGVRQSYESRLIFSHIGYIERYRRYLLQKYKDKNPETLIDINKRLVTRIRKFLNLYLNDEICFQTRAQDEAAYELNIQLNLIREKKYEDFNTKIEIKSNYMY